MREIVLDTETTGLDPHSGHRIVELAAVELHHHMPTGAVFQSYMNPERDMPEEAERIHGLSAAFLSDKPKFADIAEAFITFIGADPLVIHNAEFDLKFLNYELDLLDKELIASSRAIDTVRLARQRFPGAQVNLDALCRRFEIDNSSRGYHGALLDCELLAQVYLELRGGRQPGLELASAATPKQAGPRTGDGDRKRRQPRAHRPSDEELERHQAMLARLKDPIWLTE